MEKVSNAWAADESSEEEEDSDAEDPVFDPLEEKFENWNFLRVRDRQTSTDVPLSSAVSTVKSALKVAGMASSLISGGEKSGDSVTNEMEQKVNDIKAKAEEKAAELAEKAKEKAEELAQQAKENAAKYAAQVG